MKTLVKYLIIHVLCGLLAVYVGGLADKEMKVHNAAPINILFVAGPVGLFFSTGVLILVTVSNIANNTNASGLLHSVYEKGNN